MEATTTGTGRGRGRPPRTDGPTTRDRLLEAALDLFARQGYAATTVRQIARSVGVRDSAIYAHFTGKQDIREALLAEAGPLSAASLGVDPEQLINDDPRQVIPQLADTMLASWSTPRSRRFAQVMLRDDNDALTAAIETALDLLEPVFRAWQDDGRIRAGLSPRQLVWELFAPLQIPRFLYLGVDSDDSVAQKMITDHIDFYLNCVISERN